jgi:predicted nucleic acid-binding protein
LPFTYERLNGDLCRNTRDPRETRINLSIVSSDAERRRANEESDMPMDYADATLVVLAEDLGANVVLTTDRWDFGDYRIKGRRRFEIQPV